MLLCDSHNIRSKLSIGNESSSRSIFDRPAWGIPPPSVSPQQKHLPCCARASTSCLERSAPAGEKPRGVSCQLRFSLESCVGLGCGTALSVCPPPPPDLPCLKQHCHQHLLHWPAATHCHAAGRCGVRWEEARVAEEVRKRNAATSTSTLLPLPARTHGRDSRSSNGGGQTEPPVVPASASVLKGLPCCWGIPPPPSPPPTQNGQLEELEDPHTNLPGMTCERRRRGGNLVDRGLSWGECWKQKIPASHEKWLEREMGRAVPRKVWAGAVAGATQLPHTL